MALFQQCTLRTAKREVVPKACCNRSKLDGATFALRFAGKCFSNLTLLRLSHDQRASGTRKGRRGHSFCGVPFALWTLRRSGRKNQHRWDANKLTSAADRKVHCLALASQIAQG